MKRAILTAVFLAAISHAFSFQITGKITLEGETSFAGVKVVFQAQSASANSDSTYTNVDGEYSISLTGGNYSITLSKSGFDTKLEGPYFISADRFFNHGELLINTVTVPLSAKISGKLHADTLYVIDDQAVIDYNDTLLIEPGTRIHFQPNAILWVYGKLIAHGTAEEKIEFAIFGEQSKRYMGIYIKNKDISTEMSHVEIKNARHGLQVRECAYFSIDNSSFIDAHFASIVLEIADSASITNCEFTGHGAQITGSSTSTKVLVEGNSFDGSIGACVTANFYWTIRKNKFFNSQIGIKGSPQLAERNVFINNVKGMDNYGYGCNSNCYVRNNTFHGNSTGIATNGNVHAGYITMNSFTDHNFIIENYSSSLDLFTFSYNFFEKPAKFAGNVALGIGVPLGVNNNGDSNDTHLNVIENNALYFTTDPTHPHAFYLQEESPLVDAGNPIYFDDDGSVRDIGAFPYVDYVGVKDEKGTKVIEVYPNPFKSILSVSLPTNDLYTVQLYDAQGRLQYEKRNVKGPLFEMDRDGLPSGLYIYRISSGIEQFTGRLIAE